MIKNIHYRGLIKNKEKVELFGKWWYGDLIHYANGDVGIRQIETGSEFEVKPDSIGVYIKDIDTMSDIIEKLYTGDCVKLKIPYEYHVYSGEVYYDEKECSFKVKVLRDFMTPYNVKLDIVRIIGKTGTIYTK